MVPKKEPKKEPKSSPFPNLKRRKNDMAHIIGGTLAASLMGRVIRPDVEADPWQRAALRISNKELSTPSREAEQGAWLDN